MEDFVRFSEHFGESFWQPSKVCQKRQNSLNQGCFLVNQVVVKFSVYELSTRTGTPPQTTYDQRWNTSDHRWIIILDDKSLIQPNFQNKIYDFQQILENTHF